MAYRGPGGFVLHKAPGAAAHSARFARLAENVCSDLVIAHVRKANPPTAPVPANTHPFLRECCTRQWVFAHNGKVPELVRPDGCCHPRRTQPLGATDSEHAFYFLLEEIAASFHGTGAALGTSWLRTLAGYSDAIARHGQFNFLMSDGDYLIAYGHDRLHDLQRRDGDLHMTLVASEPLTTDARWQTFRPGELRVYHAGALRGRIRAAPAPRGEATVGND